MKSTNRYLAHTCGECNKLLLDDPNTCTYFGIPVNLKSKCCNNFIQYSKDYKRYDIDLYFDNIFVFTNPLSKRREIRHNVIHFLNWAVYTFKNVIYWGNKSDNFIDTYLKISGGNTDIQQLIMRKLDTYDKYDQIDKSRNYYIIDYKINPDNKNVISIQDNINNPDMLPDIMKRLNSLIFKYNQRQLMV